MPAAEIRKHRGQKMKPETQLDIAPERGRFEPARPCKEEPHEQEHPEPVEKDLGSSGETVLLRIHRKRGK
jgi:hypothetical protein